MTVFHRRRDFGEIINVAFRFFVEEYARLRWPLLVIATPMALATNVASQVVERSFRDTYMQEVGRATGVLFFNYGASPAFWVLLFISTLSSILVSMAVYGYVLAREEQPDQPATLDRVWSWVESNLLRVLGASVGAALIVMIGLVSFLLPGLYLLPVFTLLPFVVMREDGTVAQAFGRCFTLIKGHWWETFGLLVIMMLVYMISSGSITALVTLAMRRLQLTGYWLVLGNTLVMLIGTFLIAPLYFAIAFQYYNLLDRKHGTGLLHQIDQIGAPAPASKSDPNLY